MREDRHLPGDQVREFLEKLRATPDGDGTLLDHSLLYWGSGMSNGNLHDRSNPPAILVGGAHGRLQGNRHIVAGEDEPTASLLLAIGDAEDVEAVPHLGGSRRAIFDDTEQLGAPCGI